MADEENKLDSDEDETASVGEPETTESVTQPVLDAGEIVETISVDKNNDSNEKIVEKHDVEKAESLDDERKNTDVEKSDKCLEETPVSEISAEGESKQPSVPAVSMLKYDPKNVQYEGDVAVYTDPETKHRYKWDKDSNEWVPHTAEQVSCYGYEDDTHTYTDADGVKFFWDTEKSAWFPKIDDDFMARYQMSYGFVDNTGGSEADKKAEAAKQVKAPPDKPPADLEKEKAGEKRKAAPPDATWFEVDQTQNTKVYVSNLPTDITEQEFVDLMQKCGLVMREATNQKMKVKLYTVPNTDILKGDALCTYIKVESVDLALKILDGADVRGHKISVERAQFQMKGSYDPKLKPKKKKKKELDKIKKMQEKLFDWRPEKMLGERSKHERVVIVKNLFEPSLFDTEVGLILEYQEDLREECKKYGEVKKVVIYDRHPEGVAQITMKEPEEADEVVQLLNNRWFGKRRLTAEIWDGKIKYRIAETDSQISQRIEKWDKFLELGEENQSSSSDSKEPTADVTLETT